MVYTLTGANSYLLRQKLAEIKAGFAKEYGAQNTEHFDGESLETAQLPTLLQGGSLFSTNKLVIISELSRSKDVSEAFLAMIKNIPDEITVILIEPQLDKRTSFYKTLKKETDLQEFNEPNEHELAAWIQKFVKQEGGNISASDSKMLVQYVGTDQQRIANELQKLIAYDPNITKESIELLVEQRPQASVFQLLEDALNGRQKQARAVLQQLELAFEDPYQISNLLIWQVQALAVVHSAGTKPSGEIAKNAKLNPYVVSKTAMLAKKTDRAALNRIIDSTAELDISLKSTNANPWRLLETTILSF